MDSVVTRDGRRLRGGIRDGAVRGSAFGQSRVGRLFVLGGEGAMVVFDLRGSGNVSSRARSAGEARIEHFVTGSWDVVDPGGEAVEVHLG